VVFIEAGDIMAAGGELNGSVCCRQGVLRCCWNHPLLPYIIDGQKLKLSGIFIANK